MIDIHTHILPGMDDGSKNVEESIQLVTESARQGIKLIAATPHFYANENSPQCFLRRREKAAEQLERVWNEDFPLLILGAEVHYFSGIARSEDIPLLELGNTGYLLLEMPFRSWPDRIVDEVHELQSRSDVNVILAHIERYIGSQKPKVWQSLRDSGVQMQCNAEFFLNWRTKRKAIRMLRNGQIDYIASDCHNMTKRPPRIGAAMTEINRSLDNAGCEFIENREDLFLKSVSGLP